MTQYYEHKDILEDILKEKGVENSFSLNISNSIWEIGRKLELNLEQIGLMYEAVLKIVKGEVTASGFRQYILSIESYEDVSPETIDSMITDLNEKIFLPLREVMRKSVSKEPETEIIEDNPSREDILEGIENPQLHVEKVTPEEAKPAQIIPPVITPVANGAPTETVIPFKTEPKEPIRTVEIEPEMGLMEQKLAGAVKMPVQQVKIVEKIPEKTPIIEKKIDPTPRPAPRTYTTDPYREPPTA